MNQLRFLQCWTGLFALVLIVATFPLWFPTSTNEPFPQIPLFNIFCDWPVGVDWCLTVLLLIGWGGITVARFRAGSVLVLTCGVLLVCLNQHRLQPWHFQFLLFASIFLVGSTRWPYSDRRAVAGQLQAMRWLTISIYFYSALGKIDFEFMHTVGQQFLNQILEFVQLQDVIPSRLRIPLALAFPTFELAIAAGLITHQFRRVAGVCACLLHIVLAIVLSPVGLNHSLGVVLWNLYFVVLVALLFVVPTRPTADVEQDDRGGALFNLRWAAFHCLPILPALLLPSTERLGYWDHWLSWGLYAPHSSRVEVFVATNAVERLPEDLQSLMPPFSDTDLRVTVPIARWSLETLGAPVYPQSRFQLGVMRYLADAVDSEFAIRANILGVADRMNGRRENSNVQGISQIGIADDSFLFNTIPRRGPLKTQNQ